MAQIFSRYIGTLDDGLILSPERYHPDRFVASSGGKLLSEIVYEVRETVTRNYAQKHDDISAIVLDTSDAYNGFLSYDKAPEPVELLGSAKKRVQTGDVIISRLRPYLRQVAYVHEGYYPESLLLASSEYYILRSLNPGEDISFILPLLLSSGVQKLLNISVEGAHHPRFSIDTLLKQELPSSLYEKREETNKQIHRLIHEYSGAKAGMRELWLSLD